MVRTKGEQDVTIFGLHRKGEVNFAFDVRRDGADDLTPVRPQNRKLNTAPDRRQLVFERLRPDQHHPPVGLNLERSWAVHRVLPASSHKRWRAEASPRSGDAHIDQADVGLWLPAPRHRGGSVRPYGRDGGLTIRAQRLHAPPAVGCRAQPRLDRAVSTEEPFRLPFQDLQLASDCDPRGQHAPVGGDGHGRLTRSLPGDLRGPCPPPTRVRPSQAWHLRRP